MAELSSRQIYDRLVLILTEKRLAWIVSQVEEQIRLGKPVTRRVKELKIAEPSRFRPAFGRADALKPGREVEFRATEAYTDNERVILMLSAIYQAMVSTTSIARIVTQHFPAASFVSEQDNETFTASELELSQRLSAVDRLQHALNELKNQFR